MEPANARLRLLVGLGNPGRQYARTRHNAGFWWIDRLADAQRVSLTVENRFNGVVGRLGTDCWLLMPTTFMNRSGQAVSALARFYRIAPDEILVVHDELDLPPGQVRLKLGGGTAGHNGLRDVAMQLGTGEFWRMRLGIGHPRNDPEAPREVVDYVLQRPALEEERMILEAIDKSVGAWPLLQSGELERTMHVLHTRPKPPKSPDASKGPEIPTAPGPAKPSAAPTRRSSGAFSSPDDPSSEEPGGQ